MVPGQYPSAYQYLVYNQVTNSEKAFAGEKSYSVNASLFSEESLSSSLKFNRQMFKKTIRFMTLDL